MVIFQNISHFLRASLLCASRHVSMANEKALFNTRIATQALTIVLVTVSTSPAVTISEIGIEDGQSHT